MTDTKKLDEVPDKVEIRHPRDPFEGGPTQVWATVGREEIQVFFYYSDEIQFTKEELKGLTINQMRALRHKKDTDYLRS